MRQRSTALALACAVVALVLYASLYPFDGWRLPPGVEGLALLRLPWPPWLDRLDAATNFFGYLPMGALTYGAVVRGGGSRRTAWLLALVVAALLSYGVEVAQQFLPSRVPSLKDCAFNVVGALTGAMLAMAMHNAGWIDQWQAVRQRWFARDSAFALLLLLLWPAALLFPAPAPLGLGHVGGELRLLVAAAVANTPWQDAAAAWLGGEGPSHALTRLQEGMVVALGLLSPCLVAFATTHAGWHRLLLVAGALAMAVGVTTAATALNFGPSHALAWGSESTWPGLALGTLLALLAVRANRPLAAALGLVALALLVALVAQAPSDPYFVASVQGWEQGRFIRFHGLAQWIGWLWPFAAMVWLVIRLAQRRDD
jgi:VanZ family protein